MLRGRKAGDESDSLQKETRERESRFHTLIPLLLLKDSAFDGQVLFV